MVNKIILFSLLILLFTIGCEESENSENPSAGSNENQKSENAVPVEAMTVTPRIIEQKLPLTGVLKPYNSVDLVAEVSGKVTRINKELGDYVSSNQALAVIDDVIPESQFNQATAQLISAENNLNISKKNLDSDKILYENGDISELEYNNSKLAFSNAEAQHLSAIAALSAAEKTFNDTRIKSPIAGYISRKNIEFGSMVSLGTVVYRVVDLNKLKLVVSVPQDIVNKIHTGGRAEVMVSALNGDLFEGTVARISPQADEMSGGFTVEVTVNNKGQRIKAGMTAKINLFLSKDEKVLAIPEYALVSRNDESYVYKIVNNVAELEKIDVGETIGEIILVENGLSDGDKIVVVGMKNLGLKTKVNIEKLY